MICVLCIVLLIVAMAGLLLVLANGFCFWANCMLIKRVKAVDYENQLVPTIDGGCFTFVTDNQLKLMQLTDIHISGGFLSYKKDRMAINAVAAMVAQEKPDLVVVTGDIGFPAFDKSATNNNKTGAVLFARLMERLGVYWAPVFGNHDTESYSYYDREYMGRFYSNRKKHPHSLFQAGSSDIDGCGNYVINVKNTHGKLVQALVLMDSNAYVKKTATSEGCYDNVHQNQVAWYEKQIKKLQQANGGAVNSLVFFHIPVPEYKLAWDEYVANDFNDTDNVKYKYGYLYEDVCTTLYNSGFFDKALELGSTKGIFCGHDHINTFYLDYKGIALVYSNSIDYLAYKGVHKKGLQRGCTIINIKQDGSFDSYLEGYYQDKYKTILPKEQVNMLPSAYD